MPRPVVSREGPSDSTRMDLSVLRELARLNNPPHRRGSPSKPRPHYLRKSLPLRRSSGRLFRYMIDDPEARVVMTARLPDFALDRGRSAMT
jgi:hypothetical protein